jgi:hypothetical protein
MKKVIIIFVSILLFIFLGLSIVNFILNNPENNFFIPLDGKVTRDDNFKGPLANAHTNDRDGIFNSLAVSPSNPDVVFVGTENNAFFKSTNGGENWQWIRKGFWHNKRSYPEFYDIAIDLDNENLMYAALTNGPQTPEIEKAAGFYRSQDSGESWERSINGLPNTAVTSVAIVEGSPKKILVGLDGENPTNHRMKDIKASGGIYVSEDDGNSWRAASMPEEGSQNKYSRIVVRGNDAYASGHRFTEEIPGTPRGIDLEKAVSLIKSEDRGESWRTIGPPNTFCYYFDVSIDGKTIYFTDGVSGKGYQSNDRGSSWSEIPTMFSNTIKISPYDSKVAIFGNGNQLFKTEDGLMTQKKVFQISGNGGFDDVEFTPDPSIVYAAGDGYRVYKSVDGGDTFSQIADLRSFIEKQ